MKKKLVEGIVIDEVESERVQKKKEAESNKSEKLAIESVIKLEKDSQLILSKGTTSYVSSNDLNFIWFSVNGHL